MGIHLQHEKSTYFLELLTLLQRVFETVPLFPFNGDEAYKQEVRAEAAKIAWVGHLDYEYSPAYLRALAAILVEESVVSYISLGVKLIDGDKMPLPIIVEHFTIIEIYEKIKNYDTANSAPKSRLESLLNNK